MRTATALGLTITVAAVLACGDSQGPSGGPSAAVLPQDVDVTSLPSPPYHFEYESGGRISRVSFAREPGPRDPHRRERELPLRLHVHVR